tara:strand:- start:5432 stop:6175 length:744 start_codon:yes stop_codon:yes gene_type:complete
MAPVLDIRDQLNENIRKNKRNLLAVSSIAIAISAFGLKVTKIPIFGMEIEAANNFIGVMLFVGLIYFIIHHFIFITQLNVLHLSRIRSTILKSDEEGSLFSSLTSNIDKVFEDEMRVPRELRELIILDWLTPPDGTLVSTHYDGVKFNMMKEQLNEFSTKHHDSGNDKSKALESVCHRILAVYNFLSPRIDIERKKQDKAIKIETIIELTLRTIDIVVPLGAAILAIAAVARPQEFQYYAQILFSGS